MTIQYGIRGMLIAAQGEAFKQENKLAKRLHGLDQQMERREDESLYFLDRIWVPLVGEVRIIIMDETHMTSPSGDFEKFTLLVPGLWLLSFKELHQLDTFYNALNPNDQDALDSAAGGNFLDKIPQECLSIIESKSKVRYSRSRVTDVRANANATLSSSSHSNSFDLQQIAAALEDKLDIRMNRFGKSLNEMKNSLVTPAAPLKAVTKVYVTCGSNHSYN
nr:putative reverse transcriptase domain-containing protein [Tanacetum cinerariifolium]